MFKKILIANRGEIAVRIIQACQEMGIATVAVYSDADANSLHTQLADEAIPIGPPAPLESYLAIEKIIEAARSSGAEAIHPGYGFLSENARFARACQEAGRIFIGPPPDAIETMGNKRAAKALMEKAGVPIVPGYYGDNQSVERFSTEADKIGYPVMIKAAAGGGGKGMRIVNNYNDLESSIAGARRESKSAFGDDTIFIEKYINNPRHIEFQILADQYGHTIHLFERECSIQRRHQKVIEETPSLALTSDLRAQMGQAAVQAAQAVNYTNAGTIEFIFDDENQSYYFLEMNTRLQVEHSVTEMTTGIDLVHWQIRIAMGERLTLPQSEIRQNGHAIEARIYAEDPAQGFLPQTGTVVGFNPPLGVNIRNDVGISVGSEISMHYDPILCKLTVYDNDRLSAIKRLQWALKKYLIFGIRHNIDFLHDVINHPEFKKGRTTTHFIDNYLADWTEIKNDLPDELIAALALVESNHASPTKEKLPTSLGADNDSFSPWSNLDKWRN